MSVTDESFFSREGSGTWRQHPLVLLAQSFPGIALSAILLVVAAWVQTPLAWLLPAVSLAWVLWVVLNWYNYVVRCLPEGMVVRQGVIGHREQVIQIQQIKSLEKEKPFLCRLCNAAHLKIITGPDMSDSVVELRWIHPIDSFERCFGAIQTRLLEGASLPPVEVVVQPILAEPLGPAQLPAPGEEESGQEPEPSDAIEVPYREVPASKRRRRLRRAPSEQQESSRSDAEQEESGQQEHLPPASKRRRRLRR